MNPKENDKFRFLSWRPLYGRYDSGVFLLQCYIKSQSVRMRKNIGDDSYEFVPWKICYGDLSKQLHISRSKLFEAKSFMEETDGKFPMLEYDGSGDIEKTILRTDFDSGVSYQKINQNILQELMEHVYKNDVVVKEEEGKSVKPFGELELRLYVYCVALMRASQGNYLPEITNKKIGEKFGFNPNGTRGVRVTIALSRLRQAGFIDYEDVPYRNNEKITKFRKLRWVKM